MPDREKVIALLERYVRIPNLAWAENYGAKIVDMPAPLITDALALLKAQEPRLMTWQEIVDTAPQMPFIWLESKENNDRVFQSILFKTWLWDSTATIITVMTQGWLFEGYHVDYGRTWRCWTSRPTDEQREATPWLT